MNGKITRCSIHRLVAEHFIPNINNHPIVNHKDNDATNNTVDNLEWCSYSYNLQYAEDQGRLKQSHINAGEATKLANFKRVTNSLDSMVGKTIGQAKLVSYEADITKPPVHRYKVHLQCIHCNEISTTYRDNLINNQDTLFCKNCGVQKASANRILNSVKSIIGKQYYHWTPTGEYKLEEHASNGKTKVLVECRCSNCSSKHFIIKSKLTRVPVKQCPSCKN